MTKTVLALVPHPDDAEFFAGGTLARWAEEGCRVVIAVASDGCRGSFVHDGDTLAGLRSEEARRAAAVLGAEPPILLGHHDQELDRLPPGLLREQFIRLIRQHKPDILVAEDATASQEIHPDHRAVAWAALDAVGFAFLPLTHPEHLEQGFEPHFVVEKYYYREGSAGANKVIDISGTMEKKLAALAEHRTQMEFLVEEVARQASLAGLDLRQIMGEAAGDTMAAVRWAMQMQASQVGQPIGAAYGEAFRYVRFHPLIESLLAAAQAS